MLFGRIWKFGIYMHLPQFMAVSFKRETDDKPREFASRGYSIFWRRTPLGRDADVKPSRFLWSDANKQTSIWIISKYCKFKITRWVLFSQVSPSPLILNTPVQTLDQCRISSLDLFIGVPISAPPSPNVCVFGIWHADFGPGSEIGDCKLNQPILRVNEYLVVQLSPDSDVVMFHVCTFA